MSDREPYAPRTVAIVALSSLVVGFLAVFGGGMALLRPRMQNTSGLGPTEGESAPPPASTATPSAASDTVASPNENSAAPEATTTPSAAAPSAAGDPTRVTVGASTVSRCWDQGPAAIAGAQCDRPAALDAHVQSKRAELANCARAGAHGRLVMLLEYRYSTQFARGWGGPASNVPDPGGVSLCVKRVLFPLPLAQMPHAHDRYLVLVPLDW